MSEVYLYVFFPLLIGEGTLEGFSGFSNKRQNQNLARTVFCAIFAQQHLRLYTALKDPTYILHLRPSGSTSGGGGGSF